MNFSEEVEYDCDTGEPMVVRVPKPEYTPATYVEEQPEEQPNVKISDMPTIRGDPFAEREGKTLTWTNVNMLLAPKKKDEKERKLLSNVWGEVPAKQTTAIMGPRYVQVEVLGCRKYKMSILTLSSML